MDEPKFDNLTDREILILTCRQTFEHARILIKHEEKIMTLELWKNYVLGGMAALLALLGIKHG